MLHRSSTHPPTIPEVDGRLVGVLPPDIDRDEGALTGVAGARVPAAVAPTWGNHDKLIF